MPKSINFGGGDEFPELFYDELNGVAFNAIPDTNTFDNEQFGEYWLGSEHLQWQPDRALVFDTDIGLGMDQLMNRKSFVWAVTLGQVSAVPEPENIVLLIGGLGLVSGMVIRKQKHLPKI